MRFSNVCASQITDIFTINAPKKHILNCFAPEMAAITVARRKHREQRARGRRQRIFFTRIYLFGIPEEHMMQTYRLASHVILN